MILTRKRLLVDIFFTRRLSKSLAVCELMGALILRPEAIIMLTTFLSLFFYNMYTLFTGKCIHIFNKKM